VRFTVDGIEDRSGVGEKGTKSVDHQAFQIAADIRRPLERFFPGPVTREVET
jgi:hypothetical protein